MRVSSSTDQIAAIRVKLRSRSSYLALRSMITLLASSSIDSPRLVASSILRQYSSVPLRRNVLSFCPLSPGAWPHTLKEPPSRISQNGPFKLPLLLSYFIAMRAPGLPIHLLALAAPRYISYTSCAR
jgi:hypothetical protein